MLLRLALLLTEDDDDAAALPAAVGGATVDNDGKPFGERELPLSVVYPPDLERPDANRGASDSCCTPPVSHNGPSQSE